MADSFNNFFVTIADNIDKNIVHTNANYKDYLKNSVNNSFFLKPTNEGEDNSIIKKGDKKKGDSQDYNNYRPISLISNLSKLIKKLAHKILYNFLEKHSQY